MSWGLMGSGNLLCERAGDLGKRQTGWFYGKMQV
jgi:hypothetical protein